MTAARGATWLAIVNPASGNARARTAWTSCERRLRELGVALDVVDTTGDGDGERIARQAIDQGRRRLLAVGGDGSVHDIVNGVMGAGLPADDRVTIAQAPIGTGNDWARGLGLPRSADSIAMLVASGESRPHDVGMLEFRQTGSRGPTRRWFVNVAGAGFDAFVVERLQGRKRSNATYLAGLLRGLLVYQVSDFTLTQPGGGRLLQRPLLVVFLAIGRYCGGGMHVAPTGKPDDGLLELVAIRNVGVPGTLVRLRKLYDGSLLSDGAITHVQTARVHVDSSTPVAVQADGQIVGHTPFDATVLSGAIDVIAPLRGASAACR